MLAGIVLFVGLLLTGGIAAFHGGLIPLGSETAESARAHRILACESVLYAAADPNAIPAIDECASNEQNKDSRNEPQTGSAMHTITVKFDYDFTHNPVCSAKIKDACVSTFIVYDISGTKPYKLFSIPAPADAKGVTKGITATSPRMLFGVGKHRIGVAAVSGKGIESPPIDCNTIVEIKPPGLGSAPPAR